MVAAGPNCSSAWAALSRVGAFGSSRAMASAALFVRELGQHVDQRGAAGRILLLPSCICQQLRQTVFGRPGLQGQEGLVADFRDGVVEEVGQRLGRVVLPRALARCIVHEPDHGAAANVGLARLQSAQGLVGDRPRFGAKVREQPARPEARVRVHVKQVSEHGGLGLFAHDFQGVDGLIVQHGIGQLRGQGLGGPLVLHFAEGFHHQSRLVRVPARRGRRLHQADQGGDVVLVGPGEIGPENEVGVKTVVAVAVEEQRLQGGRHPGACPSWASVAASSASARRLFAGSPPFKSINS